MTGAEYVALYGASLTEAERRYILTFGPPQSFTDAPARNPSTPGLAVADYDQATEELVAAEERAYREQLEEDEAAEWGVLEP